MSGATWRPILTAAAAALAVAALGGAATDLGPWYQALRKPPWQPPGWLFGPAWTVIFALIAAAGVIGWRAAPDRRTREWLLVLFALNGFLNVLWSLLFFRLKRPDFALVEVVLLWFSILALIVFFSRFARQSSALLVPYLAWVTFAGALNSAIVGLNGGLMRSGLAAILAWT